MQPNTRASIPRTSSGSIQPRSSASVSAVSSAPAPTEEDRLAALEARVATLEARRGGHDLVEALERLEALRRQGLLDDQEFALAKRRVLDPG